MIIDWTFTLAGAFTGLVIGLTGIGGGALMAPILLLVFDLSLVTVVAVDLWFAAITKMAAVGIYNTYRHIDWTVSRRLWLGSIPLSIIMIIAITSGSISKLAEPLLQKGMGFLVLLTSVGLLLSEQIKKKDIKLLSADFLKKIPIDLEKGRIVVTIIAGGILGAIVTLTSIGAGVFGTLVLVYLYSSRMTPHNIVATDILHAIPLALLAGIGYLIYGKVDGTILMSLLIGSVPAAILGASLAQRINSKGLKIAIAMIMVLTGLKLIL